MTKLDIGILFLIGVAGISCYRGGFTRSVWGIFVIGIGFFAARHFSSELAGRLQQFIGSEAWTKWVSIIAIVVVVSILVDSLFERIHHILEKGVLGWANRVLGLCFGVASSGLVIALVLVLLNTYSTDSFKNEIANSRFASELLDIGDHVWAVGTEHLQRQQSDGL